MATVVVSGVLSTGALNLGTVACAGLMSNVKQVLS